LTEAVAEPYTHGVWHVKPGRADEFIAAWTEFAAWSLEQAQGVSWGVLLRDTANVNRLVGVGAWATFEDIEFWRWDPEFEQWFARLEEMVDDVEFSTMELVAVRDPDE
jgi:quinol monooxygenase YgiN